MMLESGGLGKISHGFLDPSVLLANVHHLLLDLLPNSRHSKKPWDKWRRVGAFLYLVGLTSTRVFTKEPLRASLSANQTVPPAR